MAAPSEAGCKERWVLNERYRADLRVYIDATASLDGLNGKNFEAAYKRAERAKAMFEKSRIALQEHITEHGC
jgi:hypothetical protein